ncbi:MAG: hypothetical protein Q4D57_01680 [Clostridia bacterium]|nr:hypothetical protein [Clostridia bacterium]
MNIKKIVKTNSLLLSAILIAETIFPSAYASQESPSMFDLCPPPLTNSEAKPGNASALKKLQKTAAKRRRQEEMEQKNEKAMRKLKKRCFSKRGKSCKTPSPQEEQPPATSFQFSGFVPLISQVPRAVPMNYAYPAEPPARLADGTFTQTIDIRPKGYETPYVPAAEKPYSSGLELSGAEKAADVTLSPQKSQSNSQLEKHSQVPNAAIPKDVPITYAHPAEPPSNLTAAPPTQSCDPAKKNLAPLCAAEGFLREPENVATGCHYQCDDAPIDPNAPLNILPSFSPPAFPKLWCPPGVAIYCPSDRNRRSRRDVVPRRFREDPEESRCTENTDSSKIYQNEKLLDIIFLPEPQPFCVRFPMGKPVLIINVNKNFKRQLSKEEFDARAEYELSQWLKSCHACEEAAVTDPLKNVEMILSHTKIFEIMRRVFGLNHWSTTCCRPLCITSKFNGMYLDRENLLISHRSERISPHFYSTDSLFGVLLYLVEFPEFMRMGGILPHPLFKNKELIAEIDKISALCSSDCPDECVINCFLATSILRKVTNDKYCDPTLSKMQDSFKSAAVLRDKENLMHAIGYFNLARTLNSLSFSKRRIRVKDELLDCLDS